MILNEEDLITKGNIEELINKKMDEEIELTTSKLQNEITCLTKQVKSKI